MNNVPQNAGYLEVILGPMFSGKTSRIVHLKRMYSCCNMSVCVVNHTHDTRYHATKLSTHDQTMIECIYTDTLTELMNHDVDVFLINEIQFFPPHEIREIIPALVDTHKKIVHVAGLDGTFERKPFEGVFDLIPLADEVTKLSSICRVCKRKACFSKRITHETETVIVGGEDMYMPVCRVCYFKDISKATLSQSQTETRPSSRP